MLLPFLHWAKSYERVRYLFVATFLKFAKYLKITFGEGSLHCYILNSSFCSWGILNELLISATITKYPDNFKGLSQFYITVKVKTTEEVMNNRPPPGLLDPSLAAEYKAIILALVILDLCGSFNLTICNNLNCCDVIFNDDHWDLRSGILCDCSWPITSWGHWIKSNSGS